MNNFWFQFIYLIFITIIIPLCFTERKKKKKRKKRNEKFKYLLLATSHIVCVWYFAFSSIFHHHNHQICRERIHFYHTSSFSVSLLNEAYFMIIALLCILTKTTKHKNWLKQRKSLWFDASSASNQHFYAQVFFCISSFLCCYHSNSDYLTMLRSIKYAQHFTPKQRKFVMNEKKTHKNVNK